jgi:hypothetical protein
VDAAGDPVPGASVTWQWPVAAKALFPNPRPHRAVVHTDGQGRFRLAGKGPTAATRLYAAHPDHGVGLTRERDRNRDPHFKDIVIRLDPALRVDFAVRTPEGEAPKVVELAIRSGKRDPWAPVEGLSKAYFQEPTRTTADFSLPGLSGEPFTLWLRASGFRPKRFESADLLPGPGMAVRRVEVFLERGLAVSGVLLDREGKPAERAVVHVNDGNRRNMRGNPFWCLHERTDAKGRFTVGGLTDGIYVVKAQLPGGKGEVVRENIRAGTSGLTLREE